MLDAYSYGGGFGLHALKNGHAGNWFVSTAPSTGRLIQKNADNGLKPESWWPMRFTTSRRKLPGGNLRSFPSIHNLFARSHLQAGMKKYRRVNQLAMSALEDGGILVSNSCSSMVREADFIRMLTSGEPAGRLFRFFMSAVRSRPSLSGGVSESQYLKCVFAECLRRNKKRVAYPFFATGLILRG